MKRVFPVWPMALLLALMLPLGLLAWMVDMAAQRMRLPGSPFPVPIWVPVLLIPALAGVVFFLAGRRTHRRHGFAALLLLVLAEGLGVARGMLWLKAAPRSVYHSERQYASVAAPPPDWADPRRPDLFDLGGGVHLSLSTVCMVDGFGRTLPKAPPPRFPQPGRDDSTRPLTARGVQNLVAFTRALGYIRFFHPSDQAAGADWNRTAILGVQAVEDAATPEDLARRLQDFFSPLAPTARFLNAAPSIATRMDSAGCTQLVRWQHRGLGALPPGPASFDRSVRLADVALTWTVLQHFYPYFDVVPVDWPGELPKALESAAVDPDVRSFLRTLRTLVAALQDGHGSVHLAGEKGQPRPPLVLRLLDDRVYVAVGPASIPVGSEVLAIDGESVADRIDRLRPELSAATEGHLASRLADRLISACIGPKAMLRLKPPAGEQSDLELPLEAFSKALRHRSLPAKVAQLRPGIWYADLDRITERDFTAALPSLARAKGVIFDLRGYPSLGPRFLQHLIDSPAQSARWNTPIVTAPDGRGWNWDTSGRWQLQPLLPRIRGRIAFLTGGGAISYAESCLGIVEAYRLAEIVGEPSAGTNGNVNPLTLPGGFTVSWTGMKVLKHDGSRHHGIGIQPTIPVRPTPEGLAQGRDEVLERAIEVVSR